MYKALPLALLCLLASLGTAQTLSNQYQHINNTWNAPNSTYPDCSTTVLKSCLNTYTYTAVPPSGSTVIATVPNGSILAGAQVSYQWGPGSFLVCGTWNLSVVANYIDSTGAVVSSSADTAQTVVPCPLAASPATGLASTPAP